MHHAGGTLSGTLRPQELHQVSVHMQLGIARRRWYWNGQGPRNSVKGLKKGLS